MDVDGEFEAFWLCFTNRKNDFLISTTVNYRYHKLEFVDHVVYFNDYAKLHFYLCFHEFDLYASRLDTISPSKSTLRLIRESICTWVYTVLLLLHHIEGWCYQPNLFTVTPQLPLSTPQTLDWSRNCSSRNILLLYINIRKYKLI
jgi:hypothetical protein